MLAVRAVDPHRSQAGTNRAQNLQVPARLAAGAVQGCRLDIYASQQPGTHTRGDAGLRCEGVVAVKVEEGNVPQDDGRQVSRLSIVQDGYPPSDLRVLLHSGRELKPFVVDVNAGGAEVETAPRVQCQPAIIGKEPLPELIERRPLRKTSVACLDCVKRLIDRH